MNIHYFSFTRFPSEKAHALYLAKVAESFSGLNDVGFRLIVPKRFFSSKARAKEFYDLKADVHVTKLFCIDFFAVPVLRRVALYFGIVTFSIISFVYALSAVKKGDVIFANDAIVGLMLTYAGKRVVYELHDYPSGSLWMYRRLFKRVYKIQTNNYQKVELLSRDFSVPSTKIYTAHNGVTPEDFVVDLSKDEARTKLGILSRRKLLVYTGHLYDWKGVDVLAEAMKSMSDMDAVFVGGNERDIKTMKEKYGQLENITFVGFKPHNEIPLYQRAADVLVLPNTAKKEISRLHTSPMKAFEYMASGTLVVASDIPSIREILNEKNALMFTADDTESLKSAIDTAIKMSEQGRAALTTHALADVQSHTWSTRAEKILKSI